MRDFAQKYVLPPPVAAVVVVVFWGVEIPVRWVSVDTTPPTGCRATRARAHDLALGPGGRLGVGALFGVRAQVGVDDKLLIGDVDSGRTHRGMSVDDNLRGSCPGPRSGLLLGWFGWASRENPRSLTR